VDGVGYVRTTPVGATPQAISKGLRDLFNGIPGATAQAYGGYDIRGIAQREPRGYADWAVRGMTFPLHTNFERYVVVRGPSKIEGLTPDMMWPVLGTNNDSGLLPETGILITNEATPTLLNNVLSNHRNAIVETLNQPDNDLQTLADILDRFPARRWSHARYVRLSRRLHAQPDLHGGGCQSVPEQPAPPVDQQWRPDGHGQLGDFRRAPERAATRYAC
jgi:hypothetical protein